MVYGLLPEIPNFVDYRDRVKKHPEKKFPILDFSEKKEIAIHHSLTRQGLPGSNADGYAQYHVNTHGWPGIGYSYVVEPDGMIKFVNPINWRTYHVGNSNNIAVGIVLTGDFRYEEPTEEQKYSLRQLVQGLQNKYPQLSVVREHKEYPGYSWKACCEFNYRSILEKDPSQSSQLENLGSTYSIQEGDTFWSIAKGRNFEVIDLEHANPGLDARSLRIGQVITIPNENNTATNQEKTSISYNGNSIQRYLESIGEDGSYQARSKLADKYGINNYRGSAAQNVQLLNIIRDGNRAPSTKKVNPSTRIKVAKLS